MTFGISFAVYTIAIVAVGLWSSRFARRSNEDYFLAGRGLSFPLIAGSLILTNLSTEHLIGLRFAPDEELEGLVRRILDGEFDDRKGVKTAIQQWRADHQRI